MQCVLLLGRAIFPAHDNTTNKALKMRVSRHRKMKASGLLVTIKLLTAKTGLSGSEITAMQGETGKVL
jgi:hypothetical protein